jgi:hypothetical protein
MVRDHPDPPKCFEVIDDDIGEPTNELFDMLSMLGD